MVAFDIKSGVSFDLTALHLDPHLDEGWHEHTFTVRVDRGGEPWTDGRAGRVALQVFLENLAPVGDDGLRRLPPEVWSNEAIAKAVLSLNNVEAVSVDRPGFHVSLSRVTGPPRSIYLCGPINGCSDSEAKDWREHVKTIWPGQCIDPMRRDYRGREGDFSREIVELDKIDVAKADVILVNYDKPSVGTSMEVLYAWERGKPVIVVCSSDAVLSPWLTYHATEIVHSFGEAVTLARQLAE